MIFPFALPLVVKSVIQQEHVFKGDTLTVKPYEESMENDDHNVEVLNIHIHFFVPYRKKSYPCLIK